ncbi:hypothetical protein C8D87_102828 [Lentzea atacamensis]|uniref:Transcriptional regulatory protein, C terminal n=1 Tax=Lentzea atacamensis TaxID=531938 RepID=A0ABX9EEH1_9PSEU|nr:helix-turn-helix domain-containing protein [Lentzea atacamensis]RAS68755.1 hypothetical protein C8D87_102828 [Lentzea atacamensis]
MDSTLGFTGAPVAVPAGLRRVLLATLLLRANELVSTDEIVERLWDGTPLSLDRAGKTVQMVFRSVHLSRPVARLYR